MNSLKNVEPNTVSRPVSAALSWWHKLTFLPLQWLQSLFIFTDTDSVVFSLTPQAGSLWGGVRVTINGKGKRK